MVPAQRFILDIIMGEVFSLCGLSLEGGLSLERSLKLSYTAIENMDPIWDLATTTYLQLNLKKVLLIFSSTDLLHASVKAAYLLLLIDSQQDVNTTFSVLR